MFYMLSNSLLVNKSIIHSDKFNEDMIQLGSCTFQMSNKFQYKLIRVNKDCVARPDKISYYNYGEDIYGDLICKINGIKNPFELNEGEILVIPQYQYLKDFMMIDAYDDKIYHETNDDLKKHEGLKTKNDKRAPNEAIINDSRFKIDKQNRVIVY